VRREKELKDDLEKIADRLEHLQQLHARLREEIIDLSHKNEELRKELEKEEL